MLIKIENYNIKPKDFALNLLILGVRKVAVIIEKKSDKLVHNK